MRNITAFAVLVIMIQCVQPAFSQEEQTSSYAVSICPQFGFFYGQAEEIVYPSSEFKAKMLSQLLWEIKPVYYYGLAMDFSRAQPMDRWGFFSNFSLKSGIPDSSGNMEDRDWASKENTALTGYSIHDNFTDNLLLLDFSAGVSFPIKRILLIKTYLTVSYMHFSFYGENGYGTYARETPPYSGIFAPIDDNPNIIQFNGKVINYTQDWFIIAPGVSLGYYFNTRFYAELLFQISPLIFCDDLDEHLLRDIQFRDYMWGGIFLEPGFHFSWFANKRLELSLGFSWRYIVRTSGETYIKRSGSTTYTQEGTAGAGLSVIDTGLCLKIHL
jgi:outer membrane protease